MVNERFKESPWSNGLRAELRHCSKRVRTPVVLLRSLLDKYSRERYETHYPSSYGLNSTTTVLLQGRFWHWMTHEGWYAIKQRNQTKDSYTICTLISLTHIDTTQEPINMYQSGDLDIYYSHGSSSTHHSTSSVWLQTFYKLF